MTGAAPAVARIVVVVALAVLLRWQLWLPLAAVLGFVTVRARRHWLRQRRWLPTHVALVALVDAEPGDDRLSDALIGVVAQARDPQRLIDRSATQLRNRHDVDEWVAGIGQLTRLSLVVDALPLPRRRAGSPVLLVVSAAVVFVEVTLRSHPGVFVGAFIAAVVALTDLRGDRHWRPAALAGRSVRTHHHDQPAGEAVGSATRLALLAGRRPIIERAIRLCGRACVPMQQQQRARAALDEARVSLPMTQVSWRQVAVRHLPDLAAGAVALGWPL